MALKYDKILYDSVSLATSGSPTETKMFQAKIGVSSQTESLTNSQYSGEVASSEKMTIHGLEFQPAPDVAQADLQKLLKGSYLEIKVKGNQVFHAPLQSLSPSSGYSGHFTQASAADANMASMRGNAYMLRNPIVVNGGDLFEVRLVQQTNVGAASNLRIALITEIEKE